MADEYVLHLELEETHPLLADRPALEAHMAAELRQVAEVAGYRLAGDVSLDIADDERTALQIETDAPRTKLVRATARVERALVAGDPGTGLLAMAAVIGWANGGGGQTDGENLQLYALDNGSSPRWEQPHGRTVEKALRERGGSFEGDRFVLVRLPTGRATTHAELANAVDVVAEAIGSAGAAGPATTEAEAVAALEAAQHAAMAATESHARRLYALQERVAELRGQSDG